MEAKKIEEVHGPGPISDVKFESVRKIEEWLKSHPTELDSPAKIMAVSYPPNTLFSRACPNGTFLEYHFKDDSIRRVIEIKK